MIQTITNQNLKFTVDSTTVRVNPITVALGTNIIPYPGGSIDFGAMTSLTVGKVQYSALALVEQQGKIPQFISADLTSSYSAPGTDPMSLTYPSFDTTNFSPIGLFLFSSDGTTISLVNSSEVTK
jgi:hypothetical protein